MKNIILTTLLLCYFSCYAQTKENLLDYSCDCINKISNQLSHESLISEVQNCISHGYVKYPNEVQKIIDDFQSLNPNSDLNSAQNHVRKVLVEKFIQNCPRYAKITSNIISKQFPVSSKIIETVADDICEQLINLEVQKLSDEIVDPLVIKTVIRYNSEIMKEYNLNDREQMRKFATELTYKLMEMCERYKVFGIQKLD